MRTSRLLPVKVVAFLLLLSLGLPAPAQAHSTGRWCSNSSCMMCLRLHLVAGHDQNESALYRVSTSQWGSLHKDAHAPPRVLSTPRPVLVRMLKLALPTEEDLLCDLGCGDGRVLIEAVRRYNCKAVGIDIDEKVASLALKNVRAAGMEDRIQVYRGDARTFDMKGVTIITMYLFPDLIEELQPRIFKARKVLSYSHKIPHVKNLRVGEIYIWEKVQ